MPPMALSSYTEPDVVLVPFRELSFAYARSALCKKHNLFCVFLPLRGAFVIGYVVMILC